jgi:hypothetical protein
MSKTAAIPALQRILEASRPFVPFTFEVGGVEVGLLVRRTSAADNQDMSDIFDKVYAEVMVKYDDSQADTTSIYAALKRLNKERLIDYIVASDRRDLVQEAVSLLDAPEDSDEVKDHVAAMSEARKEELALNDEPTLLEMAMQRRAHYFATMKANEAINRRMAQLMIFDEAKKPLFETPEDVAELAFEDLISLTLAATAALRTEESAAPLA